MTMTDRTLADDLRLEAELLRRRHVFHTRPRGPLSLEQARELHRQVEGGPMPTPEDRDQPAHTDEDPPEEYSLTPTEVLTVKPDERSFLARVGAPTTRERIVESQGSLDKPVGVDVAGAIMPVVSKTTEAIVAECNAVISALESLRAQMTQHDAHVGEVLGERDAYVRKTLTDHNQFAKDARAEFDRIKAAVSAIADSHVIEDGRSGEDAPTHSDT